jgi:YD repeat-containing protein
MKRLLIVFIIIFFGCSKNAADNAKSARLQFVKAAGKIHQSFEYNSDNVLVKEAWFSHCENNPADEFFYIYNGIRLDTVKSTIRSLYSSTDLICDPTKGLHSYSAVEYDNQARISRITHENGTVITFQYNTQGFIEKRTTAGGGTAYTSTYARDGRGNIISETDTQGNTTRYQYDNKINPYYRIKKQTDIITAFNNSPNNVVRVESAGNIHEIRYEYNRADLPVKMVDNGMAYEFEYQ